eukprot:Awhi_evm1s7829
MLTLTHSFTFLLTYLLTTSFHLPFFVFVPLYRGEVSRCLTALSDLSLDIHNSRQTSPHRSPSISQSDLHERSENDNVAVSSSNHEGQ